MYQIVIGGKIQKLHLRLVVDASENNGLQLRNTNYKIYCDILYVCSIHFFFFFFKQNDMVCLVSN